MAAPTVKVEISFVESPSQDDDWTDVTAYLMDREAVAIRRGRKDEFDAVQAGTASFVLNNIGGEFTPDNADSPFYPYVTPFKRVRISGVHTSGTYALFTGYIRNWNPRKAIYDDATVRPDCIDALGAVLGSNSLPSQTLVDAVNTGTGIGGFDALTGATSSGTNFAPMTRVACTRSGTGFTGTYTVTVDGATTTPIAVSANITTVVAAIEALSTVGPDVIYTGTSGPQAFTLSGVIYFGQRFASVDMSSRVIFDFSGASGDPGYSFTATKSAPSVPPTRAWGRTNQRTLTIAINSAPTGSDSVTVRIRGVNWTTKAISDLAIASFIVGGATSVTYANSLDQILSVYITTQLSGGATRTITVSIVNTPATTASGDQFYAAARAGGMRAADIEVDAGVSTLQTPTLGGSQALSVLQSITLSEGGLYFVDVDGVLQFVDRASHYSGASLGTFGTDSDTLPYQDAQYAYDDTYIKNAITITRSGGVAQYVQDIPSIDRYGTHTYEESGLLITSDAEAASKAYFILIGNRSPATRITSLLLQGENRVDDLWPLILGADIGQKYTIDNDIMTRRLALEAIDLTMNLVPWRVVWTLSPLAAGIFILDSSLLDGTDVLLY